jgi:signal transduction histidine kinase
VDIAGTSPAGPTTSGPDIHREVVSLAVDTRERRVPYSGVVAGSSHRVVFRHLRRRELMALDYVAALGFLVLFATMLRTHRPNTPVVVNLIVILGMALPVAVRRHWPVPALVTVVVMSLLATTLGIVHEPFLTTAYAAYAVAAHKPVTKWTPGPVIGLVSALIVIGGLFAGSPSREAGDLYLYLFGMALVATAWTIGSAVRERRTYVDRSAQQIALRAVTKERLRIARELHDVVAHNLGVIAVKAGVANHVLPDLPPQAVDALHVIEESSRTALTEMRAMLGVLRGDVEETPLEPALGLDAVPEAVDRVAAAGVDVDLHCKGLDKVPEGAGRAAFRMVQEALTNVVKHAAPTRCQVTLVATEDDLRIEIIDDGPPEPRERRDDGGHGLIGMRERVSLYGGELRAGPRPAGGFAVTARLRF